MSKIRSVEEYIEQHPKWAEGLSMLSSILEQSELEATIKWNAPVYALNGQNVIGLGAFKNHFGIWFFNGVFLSDPDKILVNAQQEKTKALRQLRFTGVADIDAEQVTSYILEAIMNEKQGKKLIPVKNKPKSLVIPKLLREVLSNDSDLNSHFNNLSPFKKREYCEYIVDAKRENTKRTRLEKIIPMIRSSIGLNDKYRR